MFSRAKTLMKLVQTQKTQIAEKNQGKKMKY